MAITFNRDTRIVFTGDSFTALGRRGDDDIGDGYVRLIRDYLRAKHAPTAPKICNRAVAGKTMSEIGSDWQRDIVSLRPQILSILFDAPVPAQAGCEPITTKDHFRAVYQQIIEMTVRELPGTKIVLCQPLALWSKISYEADAALRPFVHAVNEIAREFNADMLVPMHEAIVFARRARPDIQWVDDSGQLMSCGHMTLALTWLEEAGIIKRAFS